MRGHWPGGARSLPGELDRQRWEVGPEATRRWGATPGRRRGGGSGPEWVGASGPSHSTPPSSQTWMEGDKQLRQGLTEPAPPEPPFPCHRPIPS